MKKITEGFIAISRLIVGSLFIVSGLIKCNDSIGFSYKLNDYFAADVLNMEFLIPYSLLLAVMICVVEVVLGIAVIFGIKNKLSSALILAMMLFFTWLTWYTSNCIVERELASSLGQDFVKNCVEDCGCFGDALKLEPIESFYKDLFLLIFTIPLFVFSFLNRIKKNTAEQDIFYGVASLILIGLFGGLFIGWWFPLPFTLITFAIIYFLKQKIKNDWVILLIPYILTLGFTWYCLQHLPYTDFRPYKIGANIQEGMSTPEDAPKPIMEYTWIFKVNGEEQKITTNGNYPTVEGGEYVGLDGDPKVIDEGYIPPIQDFTIESSEGDLTSQFLEEENLIIVTMYAIEKAEDGGLSKLKSFTDDAIKKGYTVVGLTSSGDDAKLSLKENYNLNFDSYLCDEKVIKTIIRSNPGIVVLKKGTIVNKKHWNDIEDIEL